MTVAPFSNLRWLRTLAAPALAVRRRIVDRKRRHVSWDRLANVLREDPVLHVPEFRGDFQMDVRSHLFQRLVLDESYEPHLVRICERCVPPNRDAIDVGANAGLFSVLLAALSPERRVLAVEPSASMVVRLRANLARNRIDGRVEVYEGALAEAQGVAQLLGIDGLEEYGTLGKLSHPAVEGFGSMRSETVQTAPLDDLVALHGLSPGFVKIDVEGAEAGVLKGATETLRRHRPIVLTELEPTLLNANGSSLLEVIELLDEAGYDLFDPATPALTPISELDYGGLTEALCLPRDGGTPSVRMAGAPS